MPPPWPCVQVPRRLPSGDDVVLRAIKRIYNLGIHPEWWKLAPMSSAQWAAIDGLIAERDPYCRGVLLLGLNAGVDSLSDGFREAAASRTVRGFAIGRTIFREPARAWLAGDIDDATLKARSRATFEALIDAWRAARSDNTRDAATNAA